MSGITIHLRSETKPLEHRSALSPATAKALVDAGYTLNVERSPVRIFDDAEFEKVGATLVEEGSWVNAPEDHIILGLKELLEEECESPPSVAPRATKQLTIPRQSLSSTFTSLSTTASRTRAAGRTSSPATPAAVVRFWTSSSSRRRSPLAASSALLPLAGVPASPAPRSPCRTGPGS